MDKAPLPVPEGGLSGLETGALAELERPTLRFQRVTTRGQRLPGDRSPQRAPLTLPSHGCHLGAVTGGKREQQLFLALSQARGVREWTPGQSTLARRLPRSLLCPLGLRG